MLSITDCLTLGYPWYRIGTDAYGVDLTILLEPKRASSVESQSRLAAPIYCPEKTLNINCRDKDNNYIYRFTAACLFEAIIACRTTTQCDQLQARTGRMSC